MNRLGKLPVYTAIPYSQSVFLIWVACNNNCLSVISVMIINDKNLLIMRRRDRIEEGLKYYRLKRPIRDDYGLLLLASGNQNDIFQGWELHTQSLPISNKKNVILINYESLQTFQYHTFKWSNSSICKARVCWGACLDL